MMHFFNLNSAKKTIFSLIRFLLIFILIQGTFSLMADEVPSSPIQILKTMTKNTLGQIKLYKEKHPELKAIPFKDLYSIVSKELLPRIDTDKMLKMLLSRQCTYDKNSGVCVPINLDNVSSVLWKNLNQEFVYLLVNLYGSALSVADQYEITFNQNRNRDLPSPLEGSILEVDSQVQMPETQPIILVYQLIYTHNQWLIYDLSINGAISIVNNLRAQFSPIIQQQGLEGLYSVLKEHNGT